MRKIAFVLIVLSLASCTQPAPVAPTDRVKAAHVEGDLSGIKIEDPRWDATLETGIKLEKQSIALPKLEQDGVPDIKIKALYNDRDVSFLMRWSDKSPDKLARIAEFCDAVAIQFPAKAGELPDIAMGGPPGSANPVVIHQWKAGWQEEAEGNIKGIETFYPNAWNDVYIFQQAEEGPSRNAMEKTFTTSMAADNPLAQYHAAVRDLEATGFGSLDFSAGQTSTGYGEWSNGEWRVIITRPIQRASGTLDIARRVYAAFAVWDGSHGEVGARKMHSAWFPIQFAKR